MESDQPTIRSQPTIPSQPPTSTTSTAPAAPTPTSPRRQIHLPGALISLGWALVLVVVVFPEIFLAGGSLSTVPFTRVVGQRRHRTVSIYPNVGSRPAISGLVDLDARTWQFEPTTRYMANVLRNGSSPDWNPYQASGSLGPETLDGMQLSPLVLVIAALGGSSTAFTVGFLALIVLAMYCLLQFFTRTLAMHRVAGIGACVVFILNGWATETLTDVTCVPYLMFPIVLYAVTEFQRRIGPGRFILAVAAYAALFASTFSPGQALDLLLITVVAVILDLWRRRESDRDLPFLHRAASEVGRQALLPAVGLLVVSFILLPALDAYRHGGGDIEAYSHQMLTTMSPQRWMLVPSYLMAPLQSTPPTGDSVVYLGIAPLVLVAAALPRARGLARWLLTGLSALILLALAEHLGLPGLKAIGDLPGFRVIINAYWGGLAAAALTLGFGVAVETARCRGLSFGVVVALGAAIALMVTAGAAGASNHRAAVQAAVVIAVVVECLLGLVWAARRDLIGPSTLGALAVALVALELGSYANHTRSLRSDSLIPPAGYIRFLEHHIDGGRVLDVGSSTMLGNWGSALGIREVGTGDIMQIPAYRLFYDRYLGGGGKFLVPPNEHKTAFTVDPKALDLLSVRYLVVSDRLKAYRQQVAAKYPLAFHDTGAGVSLFANPAATPRSQLVPALAPSPIPVSELGAGGLAYSTAVAHTTDRALLAEAAHAGIPRTPRAPIPASATRITQDGSTQVRVAVDAPSPSVLVLADTYHSNWSVTVNGHPGHVGPVNAVVRGVVVPAGHSVVVFRYHSTARAIGWVITLLTTAVVLVGCGSWAWRRRRRPDRQSHARAL